MGVLRANVSGSWVDIVPGPTGVMVQSREVPNHAALSAVSSTTSVDFGYNRAGNSADNEWTYTFTKQFTGTKVLIRGAGAFYGTGSVGRLSLMMNRHPVPFGALVESKVLATQFFNELSSWKTLSGHATFTGLAVGQHIFRLAIANYVAAGPSINSGGTDGSGGFTIEEVW